MMMHIDVQSIDIVERSSSSSICTCQDPIMSVGLMTGRSYGTVEMDFYVRCFDSSSTKSEDDCEWIWIRHSVERVN